MFIAGRPERVLWTRLPVGPIAAEVGRVTDPGPEYDYDVFISYASEDRFDVALPLRDALTSAGLNVFMDVFSIELGRRLNQSVERGLRESKHVAMIVSPSFLVPGRYWTETELEMCFVAEQVRGRDLILPIFHQVAPADVRAANLNLGSRLGTLSVRDGRLDIDRVASDILKVVDPEAAQKREELMRASARSWRKEISLVASEIASGRDVPTRVHASKRLAEMADGTFGSRRQECVDELCAFIRSASLAPDDREVQHGALREIKVRLAADRDPETAWHSVQFDFTRARFDEIDFMNIAIRGGLMDFYQAEFDGNYFNFFKLEVDCPIAAQGVYFGGVVLKRGVLHFDRARARRGTVDFSGMSLEQGEVQFRGSTFSPGVGTRDGRPFPDLGDDVGERVVRIGGDELVRVYDDGLDI